MGHSTRPAGTRSVRPAGPKAKVVYCKMSTLPWDQDPTHPDAGWRVKTTVEKSAIPAAGSGRYVQEDVPKGAVIRETMLVNASSTGCELRPGTTVVCRNLEELLSTFHIDEADLHGTPGKNTKTKFEQIANFGGSPDNTSCSAKFEQAVFYWVPPTNINHQPDRVNATTLLLGQDSKVFIIALRDIAAGEELYKDYRKFSLPSWFKEFCRSKLLQDVESLGYELNPR